MQIEARIINEDNGDCRGVFILENYHNRFMWRFSRYHSSTDIITNVVKKSHRDILRAIDNCQYYGAPLLLPFEEKDLEWK